MLKFVPSHKSSTTDHDFDQVVSSTLAALTCNGLTRAEVAQALVAVAAAVSAIPIKSVG